MVPELVVMGDHFNLQQMLDSHIKLSKVCYQQSNEHKEIQRLRKAIAKQLIVAKKGKTRKGQEGKWNSRIKKFSWTCKLL